MSNLIELRKISIEFRRLSSNFLRTTDDDNFIYVKRLYAYISEQSIIQKIVSDVVASSDYDSEQFITQERLGMRNQINIPLNEADHIKAMYNTLEELSNIEDNKRLYGIAANFERSHKSFNETIQKYLEKTFKPLIDFIIDSLSKEMMTLEPATQSAQFNQHIQNNYGTANVGEAIQSTNTIQHDLQEILSIVLALRTEIENSSLDTEEKDSVIDDLDVIKEQVESDAPKSSRIKKAVNGVKNFIEAVAAGVAANAVAPKVFEMGKELLEKIGQLPFV